MALRLRCSTACWIFPDQGSNPCPLYWQEDSYPLYHQGSPQCPFIYYFIFWPCLMACMILVPQPGIKHEPPALEAWRLNRWSTREVPSASLTIVFHYGLLGCSFFPWTSWEFLLWCLALQGASWCFTQSPPFSHVLYQSPFISSRP